MNRDVPDLRQSGAFNRAASWADSWQPAIWATDAERKFPAPAAPG